MFFFFFQVKTNTGEIRTIKFAIVVIAAGAFSRKVAEMARIGKGKNLLSFPLPIEPRYISPDNVMAKADILTIFKFPILKISEDDINVEGKPGKVK